MLGLLLNWSPIGALYQAFAAVLSWFGIELPAKFSTVGANIMAGLVRGISCALGTVRDAIGSAADATINWFKAKLGIHSPSREAEVLQEARRSGEHSETVLNMLRAPGAMSYPRDNSPASFVGHGFIPIISENVEEAWNCLH